MLEVHSRLSQAVRPGDALSTDLYVVSSGCCALPPYARRPLSHGERAVVRSSVRPRLLSAREILVVMLVTDTARRRHRLSGAVRPQQLLHQVIAAQL